MITFFGEDANGGLHQSCALGIFLLACLFGASVGHIEENKPAYGHCQMSRAGFDGASAAKIGKSASMIYCLLPGLYSRMIIL
jgi:hypothetical protein